MKIVIDNAIPFSRGVFEAAGCEVVYLPGAAISADDVRDADALIVRTRTKCNASLLEGSSVKVVATATIGVDHLDIPWMESHGIQVFSAPGCNAGGVSSWVVTAILAMCPDAVESHPKVGVIGVGNVGTRVANALEKVGFTVYRYDPPRAEREGLPCDGSVLGEGHYCTLDDVTTNCDIVTAHLPLNPTTRGFFDDAFFAACRKPIIFLNAGRGECTLTPSLLKAHAEGRITHMAIDTFPHEPQIEQPLVDICDISTPHIAGYSLLGKVNGTKVAIRSVAKVLGIKSLEEFDVPQENFDKPLKVALSVCDAAEVTKIYDILADSAVLRADIGKFEYIREHYNHRSELDL